MDKYTKWQIHTVSGVNVVYTVPGCSLCNVETICIEEGVGESGYSALLGGGRRASHFGRTVLQET